MFRRRITAAITRRDLQFIAVGMALTVVAVAALDDDPADAVPVAEPPASPPAAAIDDTTFVPIDNCRLFDTRPEFNVGPRSTPLGPDEVHQQQVTGAVGDCNIPSDATGVALNVTVVDPTAASFLTVYPYAPSPPDASSLNYLPGSPPTPNKVDVKLSPAGQLGVYNLAGTVHVLADATGYYTPTRLAELQAQIDELTARLDAVDATTDGLDQQIDRARVWNAKVTGAGTKLGTGAYSPSRASTGRYAVEFDVTGLGYPVGRSFTAVASPDCAGYNASVNPFGTLAVTTSSGGFVTSFTADVTVTNASGSVANCGFSMLFRVDEPTPVIFAPL